MSRLSLKNYLAETHLFHKRVIIALVFIVLLLGLLIGRLAYLQMYQHQLFITLSDENQLTLIPIDPSRGLIYDRNGVLLAENVPVFSLDVVPDRVPYFKASLIEIGKIIVITPEDLQQFNKALKQKRHSEGITLKLKLTEEEVARFYLNQFRFPGFQVTARLIRNYPQSDTMVSALGYVGRINEQELTQVDLANYAATDYIGKLGVEKFYENQLHGKVGYKQVETDANGRIIRTVKYIPPMAGNNLYLSLDSQLQKAAEGFLGEDQGAVVAIKPTTGEVLAFVSNPRYDPNMFVRGVTNQEYKALREDPKRPLYNRALRGLYPPGSTVKPFFGLQGLDTGVITPTFKIRDPGWFALAGVSRVWKDWNYKKGGHGIVDVHKAIVQSCDTFFNTLANKMGINRMSDILNRFGLGNPTGLDVKEELGGVVPSPVWKRAALGQGWYGGDTINVGTGQGFTLVTPLQMASAVSGMANHGVRYQPRFLLKIQKPTGQLAMVKPITRPQVKLNDAKNWDLVIAAMRDVVESPRGTAHSLSNGSSFSAAGKTGTAQVYRPSAYGDEDSPSMPSKYRSHAWFIAFAPVEDPQIAIAVLVEHHPHQAVVVARQLLQYYFLPTHGQTQAPIATTGNTAMTAEQSELKKLPWVEQPEEGTGGD